MNTHYGYINPAPRRSGMPPGLLPGAIALFLVGGLGPNVGLAALATLVLIAGGALLWRPGEVPILLFVFLYSWFQAAISTFHANWLGLDIVSNAQVEGDIERAVVLSLIALLVLAIGMRAGAGPLLSRVGFAARTAALSQPTVVWGALYVAAAVASTFLAGSAWVIPGLSQVLLAAAATKWLFFFMLAYAAFARGRPTDPWFLAIFLTEFMLGIGGFFSDFKTVFFFAAFAAIAAGARISLRALIGLAVMGTVLICFVIVWTAVKGEYRTFVSGGQDAQIVVVDYPTRISKLGDLVSEIDGPQFYAAADDMLRRLGYIDFFGAVLITVPSSIDYEYGALLWDSFSRPFMPRLFFPWKSEIDDTARTNLYTNGIAGESEATSISLGWVAEMYIDFGMYGMFIAIFSIGYFYGRVHKFLLHWRHTRGMFGIAAASTLLFPAIYLESSFTKVFGGIIVQLLMLLLIAKYVIPRFCPWAAR
jgi:hypothetical protein